MPIKLSRNSIVFGTTSFLVEVSSEMITPIMPLFLMNVLGAGPLVIGLIEGISNFIVAVLRALSGYISDRTGERKKISTFGYLVSSVMKVFFVFAISWHQVLGIKIVERFGKGIRDVPRDAIITYSEKMGNLGTAFGFRKMMDAAGAIVGPLITMGLIAYLLPDLGEEQTYRFIFVIAVVPAVIGVLAIWKYTTDVNHTRLASRRGIIKSIWGNENYRTIAVFGSLFALAQFGVPFFILKAQEITGSVLITLLGYTVYNIVYTASAMPIGTLTDNLGGRKMMAIACILFASALTGFAFVNDWLFLLFFAVLGAVTSIVEITPRTFVARLVENSSYGTAIGFYQGITGILVLPANLIAGALWNWSVFGFHGTFVFSFIISMSAAILMLWRVRANH